MVIMRIGFVLISRTEIFCNQDRGIFSVSGEECSWDQGVRELQRRGILECVVPYMLFRFHRYFLALTLTLVSNTGLRIGVCAV
jgi:hypothetical protein